MSKIITNVTNTICHLVIDLLNIGFKVTFYAIEICCRGLIFINTSNRLYAAFCHAIPGFKFKKGDFKPFKKSLSKTAVIASFIVYIFNQLGAIPHLYQTLDFNGSYQILPLDNIFLLIAHHAYILTLYILM